MTAETPEHFETIHFRKIDVQKEKIGTWCAIDRTNCLREIDCRFAVFKNTKSMRDRLVFQGSLHEENVMGVVFDE